MIIYRSLLVWGGGDGEAGEVRMDEGRNTLFPPQS